MKNIVFVIADLGAGGAQRVMSLLADSLSTQPDYHIDVISMAGSQEKGFFKFPDSVAIHHAGVKSASGNLISGIVTNIHRAIVLRRMLKELKADLVISFLTETNCVALLSAIGMGISVIVSERSDPYQHPQVRLWRILRRIVYPWAAAVVFQTAYASGFFGSSLRRKVVIFNPVSVDLATALASSQPQPYILGVGRLSAEKGFDYLITAHAISRTECPDLTLVLAGEGAERERLMRQAKDLGTLEHVVFAGSQKELSGYYRNALAFILPSRFEGLPNALLEAMAYGCPVISTPLFRAAPEIIEHGHSGLIAKDGTPAALATEIVELYGNNKRARMLGDNAMKNSKKYSITRVCEDWIALINGCF